MSSKIRWEASMDFPQDFFPYGYDKAHLVDITHVGSPFKVYMNTESGGIVDCSEFYKQYLEEMES